MNIKKLLASMTLEEKAALLQGADFWHTTAIERLGVPSIMVSDGPHGLRKQDEAGDHLGINDSIKAVCFPTAAGTACSFDRGMMEEMGSLLGQSCQAEGVGVLLGPAANIKRSPLCGRNFEYFSEDPYLSGEMAAAHIRGVQREGVGTSLKHFAANNQETRRMSVSAEISERALREIYLASFEGAVRGGRPWTLMCSYNKIMGVYSSENPWLLRSVLRDEWGFDGAVMTDWGACNDHAAGVAAGLDLEMPRAGDFEDQAIVDAVRSGELDESDLDTAVTNMLRLVDRCVSSRRSGAAFDREMQHHQARKIARESMVLLKNDGGLLPLSARQRIAFIGQFAKKPRFQGGGSSHINCAMETSALEAVRSVCPVAYAQGYLTSGDAVNAQLEQEAVEAARQADVAVLFLGLPDDFESEGYDRTHLRLPDCQTHLLEAVLAVQPRAVVVLHNGAPVEMPWVDRVPAILEAYLGGQAGGGAVVDLLFGACSPCAKLAETFPIKLSDTPCYLNFPGNRDSVVYAEGVYVGYRYYDKKEMPVLFPFGHGLSYTTFRYGNLRLSRDTLDEGDEVTVKVDVTNTGSMRAKEIVQFYVRPVQPGVDRPVRELKGFDKIELAPGETGTVSCVLDRRSFSFWDEGTHEWYAEPGLYQIEAAASSRDIRLAAPLTLTGRPLPVNVTLDTTFGDLLSIPGAKELLSDVLEKVGFGSPRHEEEGSAASEAISNAMVDAMMRDMPLHAACAFSGGTLTRASLEPLVEQLNALQEL
ncbi:MAG: glycoside hydrolase family 3 C-terminal domain-containing protein [bacterium]|nr:glycoside hydrolase family 3 C-terminal domain-containing protein [bacterium]